MQLGATPKPVNANRIRLQVLERQRAGVKVIRNPLRIMRGYGGMAVVLHKPTHAEHIGRLAAGEAWHLKKLFLVIQLPDS
jgi:hypothetical protein